LAIRYLMYEKNEFNSTLMDSCELDRPREKLKKKGAGSLSNTELLAVLLNSGTRKIGVIRLAQSVKEVIDRSSPEELFESLMKLKGMGEAKSLSICAAMEFTKRKIQPSSRKVKTPHDVFSWLKPFGDKKQEHFIVITLNGGNEIINSRVVTVGLLNSSQIHPREVFADAIVERAASLILAHNHPSGNCDPSSEDIAVTRKLSSAGEILGVSVLDHIIFSENGFKSFLEQGLL